MPFKPKTVPWNRGKTGLEAGWTPERRQHQSRLRHARDTDDFKRSPSLIQVDTSRQSCYAK